jgi:hypothetical protein
MPRLRKVSSIIAAAAECWSGPMFQTDLAIPIIGFASSSPLNLATDSL